MSQKIKTSVEIDGSLSASQIANATTDTDKFLVSDGGTIKYRTGAELATDLGIAAGVTSKVQHQVKAGVAINKGQAVYVTGADGTNMIVGLASNATEATSSKTMGLLNTTVSANGFADVITEGLLDGLDTSAAVAGNPVWLGTGGNLIYGLANKPYAPSHLVFIGIVTRVNANNGEIFVKVQNGFELDELHDVDLKTTTPINGHLLGFNGTLWVNKTIAGWLGYTPQAQLNGTGFVKASGTTITYDNTSYYPASNPSGYISSYTETDTLASVTGRGASTSTLSTFDGGLNIGSTKLRWGGSTTPTLGLPFSGSANAFWIDVNDGDTGGLMVDNEGVTVYGAGDNGYVFRVIDEDVYQATTNVASSTTFQINQGQNGGGSIKGNFDISGTLTASGYNKTNWDTAYGWGNHASAGYVPTSRTITINGTSYDLSANRSWTVTANAVETDTLQTVTSRGNVTTTSITANSVIIPSFETSTNVLSFRSGIPDGTNVGIRAKATVTANRDGLELLGYNGIDFSINNGNTVAGKFNNYGQFLVNAASSGYGSFSYGYNLGVRGTTSQAYMSIALSNQTLDTQGLIIGIDSSYARFHVRDSKAISFANGDVERMTLDTSANLIANGSMRSPIFYDSNNTGYYLDPASTSNLNAVNMQGLLQVAGASGNYNEGMRLVSGTGSWSNIQFGANMTGAGTQANQWIVGKRPEGDFVFSLAGNQNGGSRFLIQQDGRVQAPVYYDGNNTNYYLDLDGTSEINKVYYNSNMVSRNYGIGQVGLYTSTRYQGVFSMGEAYVLPADGTSAGNLYGLAWSHPNAGGVAGNLNTHGLLAMENGTWLASLTGSTRARDDMRAPIFYDNNNTGYYVDPAGDSRVNTFYADRLATPYAQSPDNSHPGHGIRPFYSWNIGQANNANAGYSNGISIGSNPGDQAYGFQLVQNMWDDRLYFRRYNGGWQGWRTALDNTNYTDYRDYGGNALYAGIYYDGNNTGYYVDPNSMSNISGIIADNWFRANGQTGLYGNSYGIHFYAQTSSAWSITGSGGNIELQFRSNHNSTIRGYVYADTSNNIGFLTSGGGWRLRCDDSGNAIATGDVTAYSDRRVKENIHTIDNALDKVNNLRGVYYTRIDSEDKQRKVGVIAQETLEVLPEVVGKDTDGMYNVAYGNITALLIEGMKEQQTQIEELKQLVNKLINK
jgi:hypothetical protein